MYSSDRVRTVMEQLASMNPYTNAKSLPEVPRPDELSIPRKLSSRLQIPYVQNILNSLSYNFLPNTFFCLEKHRSLQSILFTSKEILAEALPIRCLEATFVGLYLTQDLKDVDRIPLSFKSRAKGRAYHHIVLVIRCNSMYGAVGLSRKSTLMDKPLIYNGLYQLIMEYKKQYEAIGHELVDFKLGLCVNHKRDSRKAPCWRYIAVKLGRSTAPSTSTSPRPQEQQEEASTNEVDVSLISNSGGCSCGDGIEKMLKCYSDLLCRLSEEYDNLLTSYSRGASNNNQQVCLKDLHDMDNSSAKVENRRRLEELRQGRSPCGSVGTRCKKRSASRSVSKKRAVSQNDVPSTDRSRVVRLSSAVATKKTARREKAAAANYRQPAASDLKQPREFLSASGEKGDGQLPHVSRGTNGNISPERACRAAEEGCAANPGEEVTGERQSVRNPLLSLALPLLDSKGGELGLTTCQATDRWMLPNSAKGANINDVGRS